DVSTNLYRPPYGFLNMFHRKILKDYRILLWTFHCFDWSKRTNAKKIAHIMRSKIQPGSIVLLHDCHHSNPDSESPYQMIEALRIMIPILLEDGYEFVKL
ncbi:MAG: polysaccharide deacetylase family protein, partial [Bacilli bacterium]